MSTAGRILVSGAMVIAAMAAMAAMIGGSFVGRAQQANTPQDVLSALLIEVRGLRAAMEQMASAGPRVQLALGRLQLQEQRVNNLVRRLEAVRSSLPEAQAQREEWQQRVRDLEEMMRRPADPNEQQVVELELKKWKAQVSRADAEVQRLMTEETTLGQEIAAEQGRWSEINQRLDELERALGRR